MKAMVFAAGLGTRLKPITDSIPKALVPICGKPLLEHILSKLRISGADEVVVNVHHFPDMIIEWLEANSFGMKISVSDERDFLRETGGGIQFARKYLEDSPRFLVHNVDILSNLDIPAFVASAPEKSLASLVVSERKTQRYFLFDDDMRLSGWTNIATGEVKSPFGNINPDDYRKLAFSGIHLISSDIFSVFDKTKAGDRFSITDFYIQNCSEYKIYGYVPDNLKLMDVGKFDSLTEAEDFAQHLI